MRRPVYDPCTKEVVVATQVIGHVVRRARVAAGTEGAKHDRGTLAAGTRKHFWTAVPASDYPKMQWWRPGDGSSIGTRFATCDDAVTALAIWHEDHKGERGRSAVVPWAVLRKRRWGF